MLFSGKMIEGSALLFIGGAIPLTWGANFYYGGATSDDEVHCINIIVLCQTEQIRTFH